MNPRGHLLTLTEPPSNPSSTKAPAGIAVDAADLTPAELDCVAGMMGAVLTHHAVPASAVRVRVTTAGCGEPAGYAPGRGPAGDVRAGDRVVVQVNLRVGGAPARIQAVATGLGEAVASASARLAAQVRRLTGAWHDWPWPDPTRPALALSGPGAIVREKPYRLAVRAPCPAIAAMSAMDYDVHLFIDAETGQDAIVYRAGPTGYRLARQHSMHPPAPPAEFPLTLNVHRVPVLTTRQAVDHLGEVGLPFLFFTSSATGRGNVIYRRYDGQLGLIVPAPAEVIGRG